MTTTHEPLRVVVVGAGPAGLYTADELTFQQGIAVEVDVVERLPVPFGLLRYGVAPDHLNIKAAGNVLNDVLQRSAIRLFANVHVGSDVSVDELRRRYDAVVYALGAHADRMLGIPGEDLQGSISATAFVNWYNGHPERVRLELVNASSVAVIGVGNVALDVARILLIDPQRLVHTDVPQDVLDMLRGSRITDVHIIGRRAPLHAKFTTKELREMGELDNVDVVVHSENLVLATAAGASPHVRRNLALMADWAGRIPQGRPRRLHVHFQKRPIEILGEDKVRGLRLEDTVVDAGVGGGTADLSVDMVVRAVGYRSVLPSGLPVDERKHTIPTRDHRVLRGGTTSAGEYAVGWMKRGPTGILGTNRRDAADTVEALLQDAAALIAARDGQPQRLDALMDQRGVRYVDVPRWLAIADAEGRHGSVHGRGRVKISEWDGLLFAAGLERSTNGPKIGRDRLPTGWGA